VSFLINVVRAQVYAAGAGEGEIQLELPSADAERVLGQFKQPAEIDEFQIPATEAAGAVIAADADVVVHPKSNVAAEVPSHEDAEEASLEIAAWNDLWRRAGTDH